MIPAILNITIVQGDTYRSVITYTNANPADPSFRTPGTAIDLTGCAATMNFFLSGPVNMIIYSCNSTSPTSNGGLLTLGGTAGTIGIYIPAADTDKIGPCSYEMILTLANGDITTLLNGICTIFEAV